jgi:F-type H+-transporting ATPase subunit b
MQIIPDPVLSLWLMLPFVVSYLALTFILFKPLQRYLDDRRGVSDKARAESDELARRVEAGLSSLQSQMADARRASSEVRAAARVRAGQQEAVILTEAKNKAHQRLSDARAEIAGERDTAARSIRTIAETLSSDIAGTVLGRELGA